MASTFSNAAGRLIVLNLIVAIQAQKQYLSDIDGLIGDGDHGVNMNKGFTLCGEQLSKEPGDLSHALTVLSDNLMAKIGGSMGPLYGVFFKAWATASQNSTEISATTFGLMLQSARAAVENLSPAVPGDKTLMDVLVPAEAAYRTALTDGLSFTGCLDAMVAAAETGRDSTKDMIAKLGRSSRLGQRSRGVLDAGAASCCLLLETTAVSIKALLECKQS